MMKAFKFNAVFAHSVEEQVLNPQGISVPRYQLQVTLTPKQIVDLMEQLAVALPKVLD